MSPLYVQKFGDYEFPYHYLPWADDSGAMALGRVWFAGFEYLIYLNEVIKEVLRLAPRKVLDFGCGDGRLSQELAKCGVSEVVGVDISERAIGFARVFNSANSCRFFCGDIEKLPEEGFDVAVAMEVLEHISDDLIDGVLLAIESRLEPGGHFIVSVPTTVYPVNPAKDYRHYDENTLRRQVGDHFQIVSIKYLFRTGVLERYLRRLLMNRLFISNAPSWTRFVSEMYRKRVGPATSKNGGHMLVIMRRR